MSNSWKKAIRSFDDRRDIVIPGNAEAAIAYSTEHFLSIANAAIAARGFFSVALSGGSTPKAIYEMLASPEYASRLDWTKVLLFWGDERSVLPEDPESNYHMAMQAGFAKLPIPQSNIFRMQAEEDIESNAKKYEDLIFKTLSGGIFDLVMLGMGEDGHTASLFPKTHGLHSQDRFVIANYIPQKNTWRMTLTFKCINLARHIAIYLIGKSKAAMLKHVLIAPYAPDELPVQRVGIPSNKALWIVDKAAAQELLEIA